MCTAPGRARSVNAGPRCVGRVSAIREVAAERIGMPPGSARGASAALFAVSVSLEAVVEEPADAHEVDPVSGLQARHCDFCGSQYASFADRSTRKLLRSLANVDVLAIDELGYLNIKPEQTNIFFKLMEERHHRRPTLFTTNLPYPAWQDFLGNRPLTQALLSRLHERCHTVTIEGPCLRAQQS